MVERITFELRSDVLSSFLDACAIKSVDPDRQLEIMMRQWLKAELEKGKKKKFKTKELGKVLRFGARGKEI